MPLWRLPTPMSPTTGAPPMSRPLILRRTATLAVTASAALVLTAGLASSASPAPGGAGDPSPTAAGPAPGPAPGEFRRAGAPVYTEAPDGWSCHYRGTDARDVDARCTFPQRHAVSGPPPAWRSTSAGEPVGEVTCRRGFFLLIRSDRGRGWVAQDDVQVGAPGGDGAAPVRGCGALEWS